MWLFSLNYKCLSRGLIIFHKIHFCVYATKRTPSSPHTPFFSPVALWVLGMSNQSGFAFSHSLKIFLLILKRSGIMEWFFFFGPGKDLFIWERERGKRTQKWGVLWMLQVDFTLIRQETNTNDFSLLSWPYRPNALGDPL